jgi:predicted dehydrogenase
MSRKIRWGIISTANIGLKRVLPAIQKSANGEVYAICSRSLDAARQAADTRGIPQAYGSYEQLIADPAVDAIYNPLPNHLHAEWSIRCAEAGTPVLCEKPLASDAAEAQRMVDAFASQGVLFAEAFMYRFHPRTERVRDMISGGAVGKVHFIRAAFTFPIRSEENIRLRRDMAGGGLMDVGCYCINVMRLMTGEEPDRAEAIARFGAVSGVDEFLVGILRFPSGVLGHFDCGLRSQLEASYEVRGSEGRILVEDGFIAAPGAATTIKHWAGDSYDEIAIPPADHYQLMVEDFADAILTGRPPRFEPQDGVRNMQVIDRLLKAARR